MKRGETKAVKESYQVAILSEKKDGDARALVQVVDLATGFELIGTSSRSLSPRTVGVLIKDHRERRLSDPENAVRITIDLPSQTQADIWAYAEWLGQSVPETVVSLLHTILRSAEPPQAGRLKRRRALRRSSRSSG